jgi:MtN3 and saliva related transmembrane protein
MDFIDFAGHLGSLLSSITFLPQVYRVYRTRKAEDLSLNMLLIIFVSTVIWMVYGIGKGLWPVIVCNAIICCLSVLLIYFKWRFAPGRMK